MILILPNAPQGIVTCLTVAAAAAAAATSTTSY